MLVYFTSLDVTGGYQGILEWIWRVYYILVSISCWLAVPLQQDWHDNGGFTGKDKMKATIRAELIFYTPIAIVGGVIMGWLLIYHDFSITQLWSLLLNLANTFGFIMLTFFFGYGLSMMPMSIWQKSSRFKNLQFCLYKLGKLNEKMAGEQDRLAQTNQYLKKLVEACPRKFKDLLPILEHKLPDADTAYQFAFISGKTSMVESFSQLEKLQKIPFDRLKYSNFETLHYLIIHHRRNLSMFQTEWKETIAKYLHLNAILHLHKSSTFRTLAPSTLIAPGDYTYTNFPGSFLWKLPICCGKRVNEVQDSNSNETTSLNIPSGGYSDQSTTGLDTSAMLANNTRDQSTLDDTLFLQIHQTTPPQGQQPQIDVGLLSPQYNQDITGQKDDNIYDDMSSLSTQQVWTQHGERLQTHLSSWFFRKQPDLVPGTLYYRLTWWWFKYIVFLQPFVYKIASILCLALSLLMLWCEISILFPKKNLSPIALLAHIEGAGVTTQTITRLLPLFYVIITTYYTIFSINLGWFFNMQSPQKTSVTSMLFSSSLMLRMVFTMVYNFYQMARVKDTAFTKFVGPMDIIPILGDHFNMVMPVFVVLFAVLTLVNCWSHCLKFLGVPHFSYHSLKDSHSAMYISDGRLLIDNEQRRQNGERTEHFRGTDVELEKLRKERQAKREKEVGKGYVPQNESEHARKLKEKYGFNGRGTAASTSSTTTTTSTSQSNSQYQPPLTSNKPSGGKKTRGTNIDDW